MWFSPKIPSRGLSTNIKKLRKQHSISQFDLAEKADLSEQTINSVESHRLWPSEKTLVKIADALETDVFYLFMPESKPDCKSSILPKPIKEKVIESIEELVYSTLKTLEKNIS